MQFDFIQYQNAAIGDYVFLIILAVASIIQAYTQKRKKEEMERQSQRRAEEVDLEDEDYQGNTPGERPGEGSPFGSFFEKMEKMMNPEEDQSVIDKKVQEKKKAADLNKGYVQMKSNLSDEGDNIKVQEENSARNRYSPVKEKKLITTKRRIREGFDLKNAVIYSEILKRKYS